LILDSSAIVAIFVREPGYEFLQAKLEAGSTRGIGAPTLVETGLVLTNRLKVSARNPLARFVREFEIQILPFSEAHWRQAFDAYGRFGKGRHKAALNFGDCLTYATAKVASHPLLCTGNDFPQTDLDIA